MGGWMYTLPYMEGGKQLKFLSPYLAQIYSLLWRPRKHIKVRMTTVNIRGTHHHDKYFKIQLYLSPLFGVSIAVSG